MEDTGFYVPSEKQPRLAKYIHRFPALSLQIQIWPFPMTCLTPPAFESGGAGIVSTIDDYMRFNRMLLGWAL